VKIHAYTVCVNYDRHLARGIDGWRGSLDGWTVATHPDDLATQALCAQHGVDAHLTDAFYRDPRARFDKFLGLSEAIAAHPPEDWLLLIDADVAPPADWRAIVERAAPQPGALYGARRQHVDGRRIVDGELAGYFQLFHASDPAWLADPTLGSWVSGGSGDSALMLRWPRERPVVLPLTLTHHGEPGANWCGVGREAERVAMLRARKVAGWRAERLDR
jgi:hypothetical protein